MPKPPPSVSGNIGFGEGGFSTAGATGWSEHGVSFILRCIDDASGKLREARGAYEKLVDAMNKAAEATRRSSEPMEEMIESTAKFEESTNKTLQLMKVYYRAQEIGASVNERLSKTVHNLQERMKHLFDRYFRHRKEVELGQRTTEETIKQIGREISIRDKLAGVLEKSTKLAKTAGEVISSRLAARFGTGLGALGALGGFLGVPEASKYQEITTKTAVATGMLAKESEKYRDVIKSLAPELRMRATELAELADVAVKNQVRVGQGMEELLKVSVKFGEVTEMNLGSSVEFFATLMKEYGISAKGIEKAAAGIYAAMTKAKIPKETITYSIQSLQPLLAMMEKVIPNASEKMKTKWITDFAAMTSVLSQTLGERGIEVLNKIVAGMTTVGTEADIQLRNLVAAAGPGKVAMLETAKATGDLETAFKLVTEAMGRLSDMYGPFTAQVAEYYGVSTEQLIKFGKISREELNSMMQQVKQAREQPEMLSKAWIEKVSTLERSWKMAKDAFTNFMVAIGGPIIEILTPALNLLSTTLMAITKAINSFTKENEQGRTNIGKIIVTIGSWTLGLMGLGFVIKQTAKSVLAFSDTFAAFSKHFPVLVKFANWMVSFGGLLANPLAWLGKLKHAIIGLGTVMRGFLIGMGPLGWTILAVTGAITAGILIYKNWGSIVAWLTDKWEKLVSVLSKAWEWIKKITEWFRPSGARTEIPISPEIFRTEGAPETTPLSLFKSPPAKPEPVAIPIKTSGLTKPVTPETVVFGKSAPLLPMTAEEAAISAQEYPMRSTLSEKETVKEIVKPLLIEERAKQTIPKVEVKTEVHQDKVVSAINKLESTIKELLTQRRAAISPETSKFMSLIDSWGSTY